MRFSYHVVTPFWRTKNLVPLLNMLQPMGVHWHLAYDQNQRPELPAGSEKWITTAECPPAEPGWFVGHWKFNWYLNQIKWDVEARYILLSDDDFFEPDFFPKMDAVDGDVLICSMKRGDHSPPTQHTPMQATHTLLACAQNLGCGGIGGQQIMMAGWAYRRYRLGPGFAGDWDMIHGVLLSYVPVFVPDAFVWYNYLEPGRWNGINPAQ